VARLPSARALAFVARRKAHRALAHVTDPHLDPDRRAWQAGLDRAGRVSVLPDCTLPGYPEAFVIGDLMSLNRPPGLAEVAMQSGVHAARTITRRLKGDTSARPFRYLDLGTMATIARFRAVVSIGRVPVTGLAGWLMWLCVHLVFLTRAAKAADASRL
jgi:NADH dehydrogenase FAD-containing subunit